MLDTICSCLKTGNGKVPRLGGNYITFPGNPFAILRLFMVCCVFVAVAKRLSACCCVQEVDIALADWPSTAYDGSQPICYCRQRGCNPACLSRVLQIGSDISATQVAWSWVPSSPPPKYTDKRRRNLQHRANLWNNWGQAAATPVGSEYCRY